MAYTSMNLVTSPWIPLIQGDGTNQNVSIQNVSIEHALRHADKYLDIAAELPTINFGILRILLAILYRATNEELEEEPTKVWQSWWDSRQLPITLIESYLDKWQHRFELFHPEYPFLQTPTLRKEDSTWRELGPLIIDSQGDEKLFNQSDSNKPIDAPTAARWLIHANPFDYSGNKAAAFGDARRVASGNVPAKGVAWTGALGCTTIKGSTLFETLLLNLVADREKTKSVFLKDLPIWELDPLPNGEREGARPWGQVSLMTWPQRRVRLKEADGLVDGVLICVGDRIHDTDQRHHEYMTPWEYEEKASKENGTITYSPYKVNVDRALWRGIESLLPPNENKRIQGLNNIPVSRWLPAKTVEWIDRLITEHILPKNFRFSLEVISVKYWEQSSSFEQINRDSLTFPSLLAAAEGRFLRAIVITAVERADATANALADLAENLARAEGAITKGKNDSPAKAAKERTLNSTFAVIDPMFRSWLSKVSISEQKSEDELRCWTDSMRSLAIKEGLELVHRTSPSAWHGREVDSTYYSVGYAYVLFYKKISKILPKGDL